MIFIHTFLIISLNLGTTCLTFEEDPEPFGKVRDYNVKQICKELKIEVIQVVSHTLYKLEKYCLLYNRKKKCFEENLHYSFFSSTFILIVYFVNFLLF